MLRKLLGAGVLLATLAGCTELGGTECTDSSQCTNAGEVCNTDLGRCYKEPEVTECTRNCADYQGCTATACVPRFNELTILSPTENALLSGGTVEVKAQLKVDSRFAKSPQYPATLLFGATRTDSGGVGSFENVTQDGDTYTAQWKLPTGQAQLTLTASHPTPGGIQSAPVTLRLDTQSPTFTISFSYPTRSGGMQGVQADQKDPSPGYSESFRRDELATVMVSADEPAKDVTLTLIGIGLGGADGSSQAVTLSPATTCGGSPPFCLSATIDLSTPDMRDVRGIMKLQVEGKDDAGNQSSANAGLKVTRWKWAFDANGSIVSTPAIGSQGTIYLGTNLTNGTGKTFAVNPDGTKKWDVSTGDVVGSPAVGAFSSNEENVYVAAKSASNSALYALAGSNGTERAKCTPSGSGLFQSAIAVGTTTVATVSRETAVGVYNLGSQGRFVGIRPAALPVDQCPEVSGGSIPVSVASSALVMKGANVYYATPDPAVTSYDFVTGANTPRTGWPQATSHQARNFALVDENLYGGAGSSDNPPLGDLFKIPTTGGSVSLVFPATATERVINLAVGADNIAYFGGESGGNKELLSLALDGTSSTPGPASGVGTLRGAPAVGRNDRLYTLNVRGQVSERSASALTLLWSADLSLTLDTGDVYISPALDCRRDASGQGLTDRSLGTLYVGGNTKLYALIVDSPGLALNAPWPKFQHDARNTGNPATPITSCP